MITCVSSCTAALVLGAAWPFYRALFGCVDEASVAVDDLSTMADRFRSDLPPENRHLWDRVGGLAGVIAIARNVREINALITPILNGEIYTLSAAGGFRREGHDIQACLLVAALFRLLPRRTLCQMNLASALELYHSWAYQAALVCERDVERSKHLASLTGWTAPREEGDGSECEAPLIQP